MLVVDANENARVALVDMLSTMTFAVQSVTSGEAAIEAIREAASRHPFDIAFVDRQMSGTDGIEVVRQIKALGLAVVPRLILLSAYGQKEMLKGAEAAGWDDVLMKPVNPSAMFDVVRRALGAELDNETDGAADAAIQFGGSMETLKGLRVLLVEDNELNQQVACELLSDMGLLVDVAENGHVAVDKVKGAEGSHYAIVLMDMLMPVMDGVTATVEIRKFGQTELPIVAMTASAMQVDRDKCIAAGMNFYLAKPIDPGALAGALLKWIRRPVREVVRLASVPLLEPAMQTGRIDLPDIDDDIFNFGQMGPIFKWNMAKLRSTLVGFLKDAGSKVVALEAAAGGADLDQVRHVAHSLRGTANTAGAVRLGRLATEIEAAAIADQSKAVGLLVPLIAPTLAELRTALATFLDEKGAQ
jgi:two-component system sensor histidine kinase/response regulator